MSKLVVTNAETIKKLNKWKKLIHNLDDYESYLTVRDVNQIGRRHWIYCPIQKLHVHLLSDGELRAYKKLLLQKNIVRIFSQYALDLDETLDISVSLNLIHPRNWQTNVAHVMTTDLLATYRNKEGKEYRIAYTFKYWEQIYKLNTENEVEKINKRTWQKFEIERQFWKRRDVEYRILTERDATKEEAWNFDYFQLAYDFETNIDELKQFCVAFIQAWMVNPRAELQDLLKSLSEAQNHSFQRAQSLFQFSGLHNLLPVNINKFIRLFRPVELIL
ncbi:TnsA endonuclease N-terminal domain-containing protein [Pseudoalteromonas gelatinilytica]